MRNYLFVMILLFCWKANSQPNKEHDTITGLIQSYQYQSAIELINSKLKTDPENAQLYQLKGLAYKSLLKFPEAIYAFEIALRKDSTNFQIANEIGYCYKSIGNFAKALSAFEKAAKLDPENISVRIEEAGLLNSMEQYGKALDIYRELYQKDTTNIFLLRNIAKTFDNLEQTDSAECYYEKAVKLYPHDFQTVFRLTNIYLKQKKYERAIGITKNYQFFDSKNIKINKLYAYANYLSEYYRVALENFRQCTQNNDTSDFTLKYLGLSYFKLEQYDSASVILEKCYRKDTTNAQTCYILGIAYQLSDHGKESIVYLSKTLSLLRPAPNFESEVFQQLAESYNSCQFYKEGLKALLSASKVTPNDTLLKFRIAVQYDEHLKNKKLALQYYAQFLKTRPGPGNPANNKSKALSYYDAVEKRIKQLKENQ